MRPRSAADVVFVVDEDAGSNVAKGIIAAGGNAVLLSEKLGHGTDDVDWIPRAHEWGCAIVTRDLAQRRNPFESEAHRQCGCHVFILRGGGLKFDELHAAMVKHYPEMLRYVLKYARPFIAHITSRSINVHEHTGRWGGVKNG